MQCHYKTFYYYENSKNIEIFLFCVFLWKFFLQGKSKISNCSARNVSIFDRKPLCVCECHNRYTTHTLASGNNRDTEKCAPSFSYFVRGYKNNCPTHKRIPKRVRTISKNCPPELLLMDFVSGIAGVGTTAAREQEKNEIFCRLLS